MTLKIAVLAGEASGDQLGAAIIHAIRNRLPEETMELIGVGGALLEGQGLKSLFDYTELSLMGIVEILGKYMHLLGRVKQTVHVLAAEKPDIVLSVDAPEFAKAVVKRLRPQLPNSKFIHVVAPTVWAWRPGRAKTYARLYDRLLCLFPFEPPYFEKEGLKADFIGHPAIDVIHGGGSYISKDSLSEASGETSPGMTSLLILPGSRRQEVKSLFSIFIQSIQLIKNKSSSDKLSYKTFTLPHLLDSLKERTPVDLALEIRSDKAAKSELLASADLAIAASGTMGLELALAGIPHIIAYKLHPLTHFLVKHMATTPYVHLANIILQKPVVPELLQENATPENCAKALETLLDDPMARQAQIEAFKDVRIALATSKTTAETAADIILSEVTIV